MTKVGWRGALGFVLSAVLLWFTLRGVAFADVWAELRQSNLALFVASAVTATMIFPLRARRWRTILDPVAPGLPFGSLWRSTAIGMMVNNVIPARAGEIARAFALTRETQRVGFTAAVASLAIDRLFDAIVLLALLVAAMFAPAFPGDTRIGGLAVTRYATVFSVGVLALLAVFYAIAIAPHRLVSLYVAVAGRIAPRFVDRGSAMLHSFAAGLGVLRSPSRFAAVLGWTLAHWLLNGFAFWLGFRAVGIDAPFSAALFLQGLIAIGVALPSAPGFFGIFESFATAGLAVYGVPQTQAVSWALGFHILSFIPITVIGAFYFARLGMHFRELRTAAAESQ